MSEPSRLRVAQSAGEVSDGAYRVLRLALASSDLRASQVVEKMEAAALGRDEITCWILDRILDGRTGGLARLLTNGVSQGVATYILDRILPPALDEPDLAQQYVKDVVLTLVISDSFREESYAGQRYRKWLASCARQVELGTIRETTQLLLVQLAAHIRWSTTEDLRLALRMDPNDLTHLHCARIARHAAADKTVWARLLERRVPPIMALLEIDEVLADPDLAIPLLSSLSRESEGVQEVIERAMRLIPGEQTAAFAENVIALHPAAAMHAMSSIGYSLDPDVLRTLLYSSDPEAREVAICMIGALAP